MQCASGVQHFAGSAPMHLPSAIDFAQRQRVEEQNLLKGRRKTGGENHNLAPQFQTRYRVDSVFGSRRFVYARLWMMV
jgi:hypothetical protein